MVIQTAKSRTQTTKKNKQQKKNCNKPVHPRVRRFRFRYNATQRRESQLTFLSLRVFGGVGLWGLDRKRTKRSTLRWVPANSLRLFGVSLPTLPIGIGIGNVQHRIICLPKRSERRGRDGSIWKRSIGMHDHRHHHDHIHIIVCKM